ncbi:hypothetical protein Q8791_23180 [Nocardiopsis sp. CT-R113]|uniref:Uncharacterized protein n=1 Tax=Nocardiopsis codii TaxID=3065942 RepID=A0ABU7KD22_9ACTN|nr:hypothetical protein [Nocardiopsis sp. CT-R113]MEE2040125.1 hypothetical protein [Nocardiopsis sp. CT-R113]
MNAEEAIAVAELVSSICPAQRFNERTPDTWAVLLEDVDLIEAQGALKVLGKTHEFIAPKNIIEQVNRDRRRRRTGYVAPAPANPDDEAGYRAQLYRANRAASRPPMNPNRLALTAGDDVARRRAAELRAADGGRVVDARTAPKYTPAPVRDALAQVRRQCQEASRGRWGDEGPRGRWRPPAEPPRGEGDPAPLTGVVLREAVQARGKPPERR